MYEPHIHAFSPHISKGEADQQNSQPVILSPASTGPVSPTEAYTLSQSAPSLTHGARSAPGTSDLLDSTVPSNGSLFCDDYGQSYELDVVLDDVLRYYYNRSRQRLHLGPTSFVEVIAPSWQQLFGERLLWVRT